MIKYKAIKINKENSLIISDIIYKTYQTFNKNEGGKKSLTNFLSQYDKAIHSADDLAKKFKKLDINFAAFSNKRMVGIIRGKNNRIINLFVDGNFHNHGIGRKLVSLLEQQAKKEKSKYVKIRSSMYAIKFYTKLGYKKTTGVRLYRGLKIQPMKKEL